MKTANHCIALGLLVTLGLPVHAASQHCERMDKRQAIALFERWNDSLRSGDPQQVVALYESDALLLPTLSKTPRLTRAAHLDYFQHFLADQPAGKLDSYHLTQACNTATLAGLYTFKLIRTGEQVPARYTFTYRWNGQQWLISHHHSSRLPDS